MTLNHSNRAQNGSGSPPEPDLSDFAGTFNEDVKSWWNVHKQKMRAEASDHAANLTNRMVMALFVAMTVFLALILVHFAIAFALGGWFGSVPLGFLATGFLVLGQGFAGWLVWNSVLRDRISLRVINALHSHE